MTTLVATSGSYNGTRSFEPFEATVEVSASGRVLSIERSWVIDTEAPTIHYDDHFIWENATTVGPPAWLSRNTNVNN